MRFLKFLPSVFVIGDDYEFSIVSKENGIIGIKIEEQQFYEENSGVLFTEKNHAKIRVPQKILDKNKKYIVTFRKTIDRKGYFSEIGESQTEEFEFKPLDKTTDIKIYHIADVHYNYEIALKTAGFFGDDTDLFIFNGDIGEIESVDNFEQTLEFMGDVTKGAVPIAFARGNHDTRGKLAERFTDYFPSNSKKTYFKFSVGNIEGLVLDCGEDKTDDCAFFDRPQPYVYNGINIFSIYRKQELDWLKTVDLSSDKIKIAVSHICPAMATENKGDCFDIEREVYSLWNKELERLKIDFMLSGHYHHAWILTEDDPKNIIAHKYPVIIGSDLSDVEIINEKAYPTVFCGCGIILNQDKVDVFFTDQNGNVKEKNTLKFCKE